MIKEILVGLGLLVGIYLLFVALLLMWRAVKGLFGVRSYEVWDDIPDYDFQKELNDKRNKMGLPERDISKYKKEEKIKDKK